MFAYIYSLYPFLSGSIMKVHVRVKKFWYINFLHFAGLFSNFLCCFNCFYCDRVVDIGERAINFRFRILISTFALFGPWCGDSVPYFLWDEIFSNHRHHYYREVASSVTLRVDDPAIPFRSWFVIDAREAAKLNGCLNSNFHYHFNFTIFEFIKW